MQKDCFEVYALVPGLLREEVKPILFIAFKSHGLDSLYMRGYI